MTEIEKRIAAVRNGERTVLKLSGMGLTGIPEEVFELENLTELYLYLNQLTGVSAKIGNLKNLKVLGLTGNKLSSLPAKIGQFKKLKEFHCDPIEKPDNKVSFNSLIGELRCFIKTGKDRYVIGCGFFTKASLEIAVKKEYNCTAAEYCPEAFG